MPRMGPAGRLLGRRAIIGHGVSIAPEVGQALASGSPVVALESALITHGFTPPANRRVGERMMLAVRAEAAIPAVCAVLDGVARVGLAEEELALLSTSRQAIKISLRDLPLACSQGLTGGTTVAASIHLAHLAGIGVLATGGIGGVHRGHPEDVSADVPTLATTPIIVVCSGAKSILDLPRTLQILETHAIPVVGYCTDEFPAFYARRSGLSAGARVDSPADAAQAAHARTALGLDAALLLCVPVPEGMEVPMEQAEAYVAEATAEADAEGVSGSELTPFLLRRIAEISGGRTVRANVALLESNARVAAQVARALAGIV